MKLNTKQFTIGKQFHSPTFEGTIHLRMEKIRQTYIPVTFANFNKSLVYQYTVNPSNYLTACLGTTAVLKQERYEGKHVS